VLSDAEANGARRSFKTMSRKIDVLSNVSWSFA